MVAKLTGLSFIIPVLNEQEAIISTIENLGTQLSTLAVPYEIIVVDDGSTDDTAEHLVNSTVEHLRVIRHPINAGYGAAIKTGLLATEFEWVGIVDADGSYDIDAIPRLAARCREGFDMVVAQRENISSQDSIIKGFMRRSLRLFVWLLVDRNVEDLNSGYRIIKKSSVMEFFPFLCSTFSFTTSLTILFFERGYFVCYEPTQYFKRKGVSKIHPFRDSLRALQMILQGVTYFNPIKTFVFVSILMVIVVCIPAMILAMLHMATLSSYYMIFGSVVTILFGLGILGDIVRISSMRQSGLLSRSKNEDD